MRGVFGFAICVIVVLLAFTACEKEVIVSYDDVYIVGKDFCWEENNTRTSLDIDGGVAKFSWTPGDRVGILPDEGSQVFFTIPEPEEGGELSKKAKFDGGAWALKGESDYAAYYPFVKDFDLVRNAVPVLYTGQKQVGNNSTAHLGGYDYMGSSPVQTNVNGGVTFDFDHVGALVLVKFTVPEAGTVLKNIAIGAAGAEFTAEGTYDLTSQEGFPITATSVSDAMILDLEYTTVEADEEVTAYLMVAPVDLKGKILNISVAFGDGGKIMEYTCKGKNLQAAGGYLFAAQPVVVETVDYLTFTADAAQTFTVRLKGSYALHESLQYSVNESEWKQLPASEAISFGGVNGSLRLRGKSVGGMAADISKYSQITFGNSTVPVALQGDIRTLVDYENYLSAETDQARFCYLFDGCTNLTSAPALPAAVLAEKCYFGMFRGCTNLAEAPVLPATELAKSCYYNMFNGCTGLAAAPALPAASLEDMCYYNMFYGCTGLTAAPELPAAVLAESCYNGMFNGCTGLIAAPVLPATVLAKSCYAYMFQGCTGLKASPALPAVALSELCYHYMFRNCTGIAAPPALPATVLAKRCYEYMFYGCSGISSAPALSASILAEKCYFGMFYGCTSLNSVVMLATDISASGCLTNWMKNVSADGTFTKAASMSQLKTGVSGIPSGWSVVDYAGL